MIYMIHNIIVCGNLFLMTLISPNISSPHVYAESIASEVRTALSHYPELADVSIDFTFKRKIRNSTMQAQPEFWSFFRKKSKRKYKVLISESMKIDNTLYLVENLPTELLIGWLVHEVGLIRYYHDMSCLYILVL